MFIRFFVGQNYDMSKYKIVNIIDRIFISVCVFLLFFAWINFYVRDLRLTFIFALLASFSVCFLLFLFFSKKQAKANQTKAQIEMIEKNFLAFVLQPNQERLDNLAKVYGTEKSSKNGFLSENKNLYFVSTETETLDKDKYLSIIAQAQNLDFETLFIICGESTQPLNLQILKNKTVKIINKTQLYADFKNKNIDIISNCNFNLSPPKLSWKDIAKNIFAPHKAKSYFVCGLILLFSSVVLPYNFYYIIFGSMLMLFALICKILPKFSGK